MSAQQQCLWPACAERTLWRQLADSHWSNGVPYIHTRLAQTMIQGAAVRTSKHSAGPPGPPARLSPNSEGAAFESVLLRRRVRPGRKTKTHARTRTLAQARQKSNNAKSKPTYSRTPPTTPPGYHSLYQAVCGSLLPACGMAGPPPLRRAAPCSRAEHLAKEPNKNKTVGRLVLRDQFTHHCSNPRSEPSSHQGTATHQGTTRHQGTTCHPPGHTRSSSRDAAQPPSKASTSTSGSCRQGRLTGRRVRGQVAAAAGGVHCRRR